MKLKGVAMKLKKAPPEVVRLSSPKVVRRSSPAESPPRFTLPEVADLLERALGPSDAVCWLRKEAGRG